MLLDHFIEVANRLNSNMLSGGIVAIIVILVIIAVFITISMILLNYPQWIWGAYRHTLVKKLPVKIAHRGGASEAPENKIEAFQRAVDHGMDML